MKWNLLLAQLSFLFFIVSCQGKSTKTIENIENSIKIEQNILQKTQGEAITDEELQEFLSKFKNALINRDIDAVSEMVHFPLDGDAIYYMVYGDVVFEKGLKPFIDTVDKEVFKKNFSKIFSDETIFLVRNFDINKAMNETEYSVWNEQKTEILSFYRQENSFSLEQSHIDDNESINEYGIGYIFKKSEGKILLYFVLGRG